MTRVRQSVVEDDWMNFQRRHDACGHPASNSARGFHAFIVCRASQENIASSSFTPNDGKAYTAELLREEKKINPFVFEL